MIKKINVLAKKQKKDKRFKMNEFESCRRDNVILLQFEFEYENN